MYGARLLANGTFAVSVDEEQFEFESFPEIGIIGTVFVDGTYLRRDMRVLASLTPRFPPLRALNERKKHLLFDGKLQQYMHSLPSAVLPYFLAEREEIDDGHARMLTRYGFQSPTQYRLFQLLEEDIRDLLSVEDSVRLCGLLENAW